MRKTSIQPIKLQGPSDEGLKKLGRDSKRLYRWGKKKYNKKKKIKQITSPNWIQQKRKNLEEIGSLFDNFMTNSRWNTLYKKFPNCEDRNSSDMDEAVYWIIKEMKKKYGKKKIEDIEPELIEIIVDTLM